MLIEYRMQFNWICMLCSITLCQVAKRAQTNCGAVAKGNRLPFWALCLRQQRTACIAEHVSNTPLGELHFKKLKKRPQIKKSFYRPRSIYISRSIQPYHFQADLIWCDGAFQPRLRDSRKATSERPTPQFFKTNSLKNWKSEPGKRYSRWKKWQWSAPG